MAQKLLDRKTMSDGIVAITGDEMAKNKCVERALRAAFKFSGFAYPVELKEQLKWSKELHKFCKDLGLEVYDDGQVYCDSRPVFVIYQVPDQTWEENEDGYQYHAVFCSDIGPLHRYKIHTIVMGWESLIS